MATTFRADRAAEAIRMTVATALTTEVQDPRLRGVTITGCRVSRDLQHANLYYTVMGDEAAQLQAERGFVSATPFLRTRVGEEVPLRTVPELQFHFDHTTEAALRIEEILAKLPELHPEAAELSTEVTDSTSDKEDKPAS